MINISCAISKCAKEIMFSFKLRFASWVVLKVTHLETEAYLNAIRTLGYLCEILKFYLLRFCTTTAKPVPRD